MKALLPLVSILLGILFNEAYTYSFLIKYLLMAILFFPFLEVSIDKFYPNLLWIAAANVLIAIACYFIVLPLNSELALIGFITAISPTATSAPAIMSFLRGNVEYVTFSVLLTNGVITVTIPFLIPFFIDSEQSIATQDILFSILFVFLTPLTLAQLIKLLTPQLHRFILTYKFLAFYIWNLLLFIASAKSAHYLFYEVEAIYRFILFIASLALILCIVNFSLGRLIGGKDLAHEASQSLGHKNTMLTVWLSLSFLSPLVALGPIFYLVYHNLYNSYQIFRTEKLS